MASEGPLNVPIMMTSGMVLLGVLRALEERFDVLGG